MAKELSKEELLDRIWEFWEWTKKGYERAGMSDPFPEDAEQAYQQIRKLIENIPTKPLGHRPFFKLRR